MFPSTPIRVVFTQFYLKANTVIHNYYQPLFGYSYPVIQQINSHTNKETLVEKLLVLNIALEQNVFWYAFSDDLADRNVCHTLYTDMAASHYEFVYV